MFVIINLLFTFRNERRELKEEKKIWEKQFVSPYVLKVISMYFEFKVQIETVTE